MQIVYVFLDEGGNLDFSSSGTRYFSISCVSMQRPFALHMPLDTYKYDLIEFGLNTELFHCADDNAHVRGKVFDILCEGLHEMRIDSLLIDKCKTEFALQDPIHFYPLMLGQLLKFVIDSYDKKLFSEVIVITDAIPVKRKRKAIEKAVKLTLSAMIPDKFYRVLHHASRSHYGLQIADYCNWAIFRKWEKGDHAFYRRIQGAIASEHDIFRDSVQKYY